MKKIIAVAAFVLAVSISALAQDGQRGTRMGQNSVNYGLMAGYGTNDLAHFGNIVMDFNKRDSAFRLRTTLGIMERYSSPAASVNAQYLIHLFGGLYVYPSVGLYAEYHKNGVVNQFSAGGIAGAGLEYQFSSKIGFFAEGGYHVLTPIPNRSAVTVGFMLHL